MTAGVFMAISVVASVAVGLAVELILVVDIAVAVVPVVPVAGIMLEEGLVLVILVDALAVAVAGATRTGACAGKILGTLGELLAVESPVVEVLIILSEVRADLSMGA